MIPDWELLLTLLSDERHCRGSTDRLEHQAMGQNLGQEQLLGTSPVVGEWQLCRRGSGNEG